MHWPTAVLVLLGLLNLVATAGVVGSPSYSAAQRMLQTIVIWLLPVVGAVLCIRMVQLDAREAPPVLSAHDPDPGTGVEAQGPSLCGCGGAGASGDRLLDPRRKQKMGRNRGPFS